MLAQVLECPLDEVLCYPDLPAPDTLCQQLAANEGIVYEDFTAVIVVDGLGSLLSSPEDMKNKSSPFYSALTTCVDLALQGAFIVPLCTATITGSLRKYLADTNRRRVFLEIPPLHPPVIKASGKPAFPTGLVNDLLVSDCGGHGRALEALYQTYQTENLENITNYDDLVCLVISDLKDQYGDAFQRESHEYFAILKLVLSKTQLTRTSAIAGTDLTVELAEGNGLVRFEPAVDCQNTGYLSVPFIWIKTFVSLYDGQKENYPMSRFLANFLRYHEQIGILRNDPVKTQGWQLFENFAAGFRVLKSLSIDEGQQVKLSQIHYGATRSGPDLEFINRHMQHVHSTKEIRASSFEESPVKVKCTEMRFSKSEAETIEAYIPSSRYCAVNGAHARGGDIFNLLEVSGLGTKVLGAGQCKKTAYLNSSSLWSEVKKATPEGGVSVLYTTADLTEDLDTSKHCTSQRTLIFQSTAPHSL
ncbi:hypothetical protein BGX38DRAFT_155614 [Terfezia claveryi]|nr:hypothetical protein BGX38DRAFT_155614 [Terfezia claveryi]